MNLYIALDDARTWAAARKIILSISLSVTGELTLRGYKAAEKDGEQPDQAQWTLSEMDLRKGFSIDPPTKLGDPPTEGGLGAQLQTLLGAPLGLSRLAAALSDDKNDLTVAIVAQATSLRAQLAKGDSIDPWQKGLDDIEATLPKALNQPIPFHPS